MGVSSVLERLVRERLLGGEKRERGILVSKIFLWLMLIEVCLGVKMEKVKTFIVIGVNFPYFRGSNVFTTSIN